MTEGMRNGEKAAGVLFYDWVPSYNKDMQSWQWVSPQRIFTAIRPHMHGNETILDLGIGTGLLSSLFKKHTDAYVTGIDACSKMLKKCRKAAAADRLVKGDFDRQALPFLGGEFDAVVCSGALEFVGNILFLSREIARVTRQGGLVALTYQLAARNDIEEQDTERCYLMRAHSHVYIRQQLEEAGIDILDQQDFDGYRPEWNGGQPVRYGLTLGRVS
jgi:predicted TPR repeat methyltransferase